MERTYKCKSCNKTIIYNDYPLNDYLRKFDDCLDGEYGTEIKKVCEKQPSYFYNPYYAINYCTRCGYTYSKETSDLSQLIIKKEKVKKLSNLLLKCPKCNAYLDKLMVVECPNCHKPMNMKRDLSPLESQSELDSVYFNNILLKNYLNIKNPFPFIIDVGDITTFDGDAIVNAANSSLMGGGGVDGAIHEVAGKELDKACKKLGGCTIGEAKITPGFNLKVKYIIHTVGPIYNDYDKEDAEHLLEKCYKNCLDLAKANHIHSIAFPCISSGSYDYPIEESSLVAIRTAKEWLEKNNEYDIKIFFVCYRHYEYDCFLYNMNK